MSPVTHTTRWEWKVLLAPEPAARIAALAGTLLSPDPFALAARTGAYAVASVYLGVPGDVAHEGSPRWRVRRYGDDARVWLERKSSRGGRVEKQRVACDPAVALGATNDLAQGHPARAWLAEVEARGLVPALTVAYEREAWVLPGTSARLTVDRRLRARPASQRLPEERDGGVPFLETHVLELKFDDAPPEAFRRILRAEGLVPGRWSKVRAAAQALARAPALLQRRA